MLLAFIVGGGSAFVASQLREPVYEATTTILINQAPGALPDADTVLQGQRVSSTYAELLHQRPVLEEVISNLGLSTDTEDLDKRISVIPIRDTNLLEVTVRDSDPYRAASIANEIVRVFVEQNLEFQASRYAASLESLGAELRRIQADIERTEASIQALDDSTDPLTAEQMDERSRLEEILAEYQSSYATLFDRYEGVRLEEARTTDRVSIVESALSGQRAGPSTLTTTLQGAVVGIMLAMGVVFLVEYLRDTVTSSEEVEQLIGAPALGVIGAIKIEAPGDALVAVTRPRSPTAEAYRVLRANIEFSGPSDNLRTIVVTSSGPAEGKTTTAANLAAVLAQAGKRVVLVDADLRHPTLHKLFGQTAEKGVTRALVTGEILEQVIPTEIENLYLMPCGPLPPNPAELLGSPQMAALIETLKSEADVLLFDSPPVLAVADAAILARTCDATLLVVQTGLTKARVLARAKNQITQAGGHLLGAVLNRVSFSRDGYYYYYHRYYSSEEDER